MDGSQNPQSGTQTGYQLDTWELHKTYSVGDAAKLLGTTRKTVRGWCESGKLAALVRPYGSGITFEIPGQALTLFRQTHQAPNPPTIEPKAKPLQRLFHLKLVPDWVKAMQRGLMTGKPFSPTTIEMYTYYVDLYFKSHSQVSLSGLQAELLNTETSAYCKRFKLFKSVVCFAKYLIREGALEKSFLEEVKPLYPKRHLPPNRLSVDEKQLGLLMAQAKTPFQHMMLALLVNTGLRVSEAIALKRKDVDLEQQTLIVRLGKGNKTRTIGLSLPVVKAISSYLDTVSSRWVFSDEEGQQLTRMGLYHRLKRLGERAGLKVAPHALRRTFVTLNANKGRPLQMLQKACGHSDIKTTMSYCMTSEQEVVEAMKGWD